MKKALIAGAILTVTASLAGCSGFRQAAGMTKTVPDEFLVVSTAPLTVPPEYNLRPPRPGQATPQELRPNQEARVAVFGDGIGEGASPGEQALIARAGATAVDSAIRGQIDFARADTLRKPRSMADRILFWRDGAAPAAEPGDGVLVDPAAEAERLAAEQRAIDAATGGGEVVIRKGERGFRLPGT